MSLQKNTDAPQCKRTHNWNGAREPRAWSGATFGQIGAPGSQRSFSIHSNQLHTLPPNSGHHWTSRSQNFSQQTPTESQLVGAATSHQSPMSSRLARRNSGRQMPLWKNNARKLLQRSAAALGAQITRTIRSIGSVNGHDSSCDDLHACPLPTTQMVETQQRRQTPCAASIAELACTAARNATFDPLDAPDALKHTPPPLPDFN